MMVRYTLHRNISLPNIPKLHKIMMPRHQIVLLIRVVVDIRDEISLVGAHLEAVLLAMLV